LPPEGDDFQYKIKSAAEPHERVVKESQLNRRRIVSEDTMMALDYDAA
jgi:hypothetical protein